MTNPPLSDHSTIGELEAAGANVTAICRSCGTAASVNLRTMRLSFGAATPLRRIALRIACTGCGAADCSVHVTDSRDD
ncbi:hypothetical protein [Oricola sp.]|uniref:hypothetical protein n=1 Tax=Oricola sp. TaxID=1979950 RepID=UPI003BA90C68